jgi:two-component system invasion response regulator UvrY
MTKILIADDHRLVREGLRQILEDTEDIQVLGEAGNGHEVLQCVSQTDYDVVLLDISMPGMNGLDVLKQLRVTFPDCKVLILSMYPEDQYAVRLLQAGASGYLTKDNAPDELISAIRKVASGGRYVSSSLAERLAVLLQRGSERPPHELLSDREYQVSRGK